MVKEAEAHAEDDKRRRELVEARNQADSTIHSTEKSLKEAGPKIPADLKKQIEQAIADVKHDITGENLQLIRQATERLLQSGSKIGELLNRAASRDANDAGSRASTSADRSGSSDDDVVDAEFEEIDPRNRKAS
jgi:molecular chaperone DnaK